MLVIDDGAAAVPVKGDRRAREIQGASRRSHHHLHPAGIAGEGAVQRSSGRANRISATHALDRATDRLDGDEGLVALYVHAEVELAKRFLSNHFRDALRATLVSTRGRRGLEPGSLDYRSDLGRVGRNHDAVGDAAVGDTPD